MLFREYFHRDIRIGPVKFCTFSVRFINPINRLRILRLPAVFDQIDPASLVELNAFFFQKIPLHDSSVGIGQLADFAFGIDDPKPRHLRIRLPGERIEGVPHQPRLAFHARQFRNLPVGRQLSLGNALDGFVDSGVGGGQHNLKSLKFLINLGMFSQHEQV